jgi:hypothetical protein
MKKRTLPDAIALLEARDWQGAHAIAQDCDEPHAAWAHGIVHIIEGDEANARYWYGQAGRPFPGMGSIDAEIAALKTTLEGQT